VSFYVATYLALTSLHIALLHWIALASVSVATTAAVVICEHGRWPLGLFVPPRLASREFALGAIAGAVIVGIAVVMVDVSSELRHEVGRGFPWIELIAVYVPAALHEELLFRGYAFQKFHRWNRWFAILFVALVFAALHLRNASVTFLGLANIFLGGVLLGLAWERYRRLWFPIGMHLAWNLTTGPITGHEVSGYVPSHSLLVTRGEGPWWVTGAGFGVEGSVWMTGVVVVAIVVLLKVIRTSSEGRVQSAESEKL